MADDATTASAGTNDNAPTGGQDSKTFTQDQVNDLIAREKGNLQRKYDGFDDLKAKAEEFDKLKASQQSDLEKVQAERDELKGKLTPLETENLRLRVAASKQLPAQLIDRLKGGTKEEMESDADELLKLVGSQTAASFDGGARETAPTDDMNALIRQAAGRT